MGKRPEQSLAELAERVELPTSWRVALLRPRKRIGLWGDEENRAFQQLPAVPAEVTAQLLEEVRQFMLPAARAGCW